MAMFKDLPENLQRALLLKGIPEDIRGLAYFYPTFTDSVEAAKYLEPRSPDAGYFLLRLSSRGNDYLAISISVRRQKVRHVNVMIERTPYLRYYINQHIKFDTFEELRQHYSQYSIRNTEKLQNIKLLVPLHRGYRDIEEYMRLNPNFRYINGVRISGTDEDEDMDNFKPEEGFLDTRIVELRRKRDSIYANRPLPRPPRDGFLGQTERHQLRRTQTMIGKSIERPNIGPKRHSSASRSLPEDVTFLKNLRRSFFGPTSPKLEEESAKRESLDEDAGARPKSVISPRFTFANPFSLIWKCGPKTKSITKTDTEPDKDTRNKKMEVTHANDDTTNPTEAAQISPTEAASKIPGKLNGVNKWMRRKSSKKLANSLTMVPPPSSLNQEATAMKVDAPIVNSDSSMKVVAGSTMVIPKSQTKMVTTPATTVAPKPSALPPTVKENGYTESTKKTRRKSETTKQDIAIAVPQAEAPEPKDGEIFEMEDIEDAETKKPVVSNSTSGSEASAAASATPATAASSPLRRPSTSTIDDYTAPKGSTKRYSLRAPCPTPTKNEKTDVYYSKPVDESENRIDELRRVLQESDYCDCGILLEDSILPGNWTLHRSLNVQTYKWIFYQDDNGETTWDLPEEIIPEITPHQFNVIAKLSAQCDLPPPEPLASWFPEGYATGHEVVVRRDSLPKVAEEVPQSSSPEHSPKKKKSLSGFNFFKGFQISVK